METLKNSLLALGIPGLFLIAVLDSAGVPLPGGVDVVIMLLSWQRPALFFVIAGVAALGSAIGCLVLYRIGRKGGEVVLRRFDPARTKWVMDKVRDNDVFAILVAMLGPPPFPTKIFILVAGVVEMPWKRFVVAVFVGRLTRFLGEAYLAVRLGDRAAETLRAHYPTIGILLVASVLLYLVVKHLRHRGEQPTES